MLQVYPSFPANHNYIKYANLRTTPVPEGSACLLAAWGIQSATGSLFRPRQVQVQQPTITNAACASVLFPHANRITTSMMCATSSTAQAPCLGNLGSGLYCNGFLSGVLTSGIACGAANVPAVYHQIRLYRSWIDSQILRTDEEKPGCIPFVTEGFPVRIPKGERCLSYIQINDK